MDNDLDLPTSLMINASVGNLTATATPSQTARTWILSNAPPKVRAFLKPPPKADPRDWRDARVGWGLVLPHNQLLPQHKWSTAEDAPEPLKELVKQRGQNGLSAPILRYRAGTNRIGFLYRDGADLPVSQSPFGIGEGCVPRYLLLYGTPEDIPWEAQYALNGTRAVGRLTLQDKGLENYVQALMSDWNGSTANYNNSVIWATDHGSADITSLMRAAIAEKVVERLQADATLGPNTCYVNGSESTGARATALRDMLASKQPGFILTTSHGQTSPLDNVDMMSANLGLLVDTDRALVKPIDLLQNWKPGGAIWYAHACCGAGSDSQTLFDGLVEPNSMVDQVLKGVAKIGARVSPLPNALLGADSPLRAFVGHVEPTFDWTLRQKITGQFLTEPIAQALYDDLFQPSPIGLAMGSVYGQLGGIYADYDRFARKLSRANMLHRLLVARDIQSTVILGDPTASLPK